MTVFLSIMKKRKKSVLGQSCKEFADFEEKEMRIEEMERNRWIARTSLVVGVLTLIATIVSILL